MCNPSVQAKEIEGGKGTAKNGAPAPKLANRVLSEGITGAVSTSRRIVERYVDNFDRANLKLEEAKKNALHHVAGLRHGVDNAYADIVSSIPQLDIVKKAGVDDKLLIRALDIIVNTMIPGRSYVPVHGIAAAECMLSEMQVKAEVVQLLASKEYAVTLAGARGSITRAVESYKAIEGEGIPESEKDPRYLEVRNRLNPLFGILRDAKDAIYILMHSDGDKELAAAALGILKQHAKDDREQLAARLRLLALQNMPLPIPLAAILVAPESVPEAAE